MLGELRVQLTLERARSEACLEILCILSAVGSADDPVPPSQS